MILFNLWNPNSYFYVKNKFGEGSPPSYRSVVENSDELNEAEPGKKEKANSFTVKSAHFVWLVELLEEFGKLGGFQYLTKYFSTIQDIEQVALFLRTCANAVQLLSVSFRKLLFFTF